MKYFRYALYVFGLTLALWIFPTNPSPADFFTSENKLLCASMKEMNKYLFTERRLAYAATFIENRGYVMSLFFSPRTGDWVIVGNLDDGTSCIITEGFGFWTVVTREAAY